MSTVTDQRSHRRQPDALGEEGIRWNEPHHLAFLVIALRVDLVEVVETVRVELVSHEAFDDGAEDNRGGARAAMTTVTGTGHRSARHDPTRRT